MWLLFSILTVLLWGTSDVIFKSAASDDANSVLRLLAYNGIILGVCSLLYMLIIGGSITLQAILTYLPIATIYITSMLFYYKAMPKIKISIASPIANSSCLLTTLLCIFVLNQQVTWLQIGGIALIVVGLVVLSFEKEEGFSRIDSREARRRAYIKGVGFALLYFVLDGVGSFLDDYVLDDTLLAEEVIVSYGLIYLLVGVVCYIALKTRHRGYRFFSNRRKVAGSLVETAGQFTFVYAFAFGDAALASPFIAAFAAVSVILSRIFLKEKLTAKQYGMVAMMLAGMAILAIE
ncbi:MAG: EamA family transporter [Christensenellales bacterium]